MPYLSQRRMPKQPAELRVLPGLYWHRITEKSQKQFFEDEWVVGTEVNRMGYRFKGALNLSLLIERPHLGLDLTLQI
jgi:allophanate hydrolase subunit 2|tara:strand:+ start:199 stop:429 length:231 start_codon:yes stop_codon:yes gene_type:complete